MKKPIIDEKTWSEMDDITKIWDVIAAATHNPIQQRPTYEYLTRFISDLGNAYTREIALRKSIAKSAMVHTLLNLLLIVIAMAGWVR